jgi:hypothetical protein
MNNFHIYEEVGRGKYSVVYKVRLGLGNCLKELEIIFILSVKPRLTYDIG